MGLEGTWTNELGSTLVIDAVTDGGIVGTYTTAVSTGSCAKGSFVVIGRTDTDSGGSSVGWTVAWTNQGSSCASVTSWAGQLQDEGDVLVAFWLLSSQASEGATWASTNVGVDFFQPADSERRAVAATQRPLGASHP